LPLLSSVDGRVLETIVSPDGRILPGEYFVYVMLDWPQVRQYLVMQTAADALELQYVADAPLAAPDCDRLLGRLRRTAGEQMRIALRQVEAIAPLPSGKRRITVALAKT